ncbi:hypothetical protein NECID01_1786 [Nematocida sp. AWRm77]|nr:hypothetical protein NECID01_1786 [Nematocida sp. AWRm77]
MKEEPTRTLLVTNFSRERAHAEILDVCKQCGEIREHFIMQNKPSVLFVSFYDIRGAEKAFSALRSSKAESYTVKYSLSMCEIPKGTDACTEEKHQGSLSFVPGKDVQVDQAQIKSQAKRNNELCMCFYDSRAALKFFSHLLQHVPGSSPRLLWDNDLRKRRQLLLEAEEIVKNAPIGQHRPLNESSKRAAVSETRKRPKSTRSNWMLSLFDRYIASKAREIAKELD